MTTLREVLAATERAGIVLAANVDRLIVDAPPGALTPKLRDELRRHKPSLLKLLAAPENAFVFLRGGMVVPTEPYQLVLRLEADGIALRRIGDSSVITAEPADRLTSADRAALDRWRYHVAMLLSYIADDRHLFTDRAPREVQNA